MVVLVSPQICKISSMVTIIDWLFLIYVSSISCYNPAQQLDPFTEARDTFYFDDSAQTENSKNVIRMISL